MGYLAPGENFENMRQLKHFRFYFGEILNRKWLLSHRNNDICYSDTVSDASYKRKFLND